MSVLDRWLRPGTYPGLRLVEPFVAQLVAARANPLARYRLARLGLYYAAAEDASDAVLASELVLQEHRRGTALERQQFVDFVRDLARRAEERPGLYHVRLLNSVGQRFGTLVSESVPRSSAGASAPRLASPEAPRRIVLV